MSSRPGTSHGPTLAQSGVYRTPQHVDAVRQALAEGALWIEVDLADVASKAALMDTFADALGLDRQFGQNWDALADALSDLSRRPASAYALHLCAASRAARALGADWATLIEVLRHVADYWKAQGTPFIALVDEASELPPWI